MTELDTSTKSVEKLASALEHDQNSVEDVGLMLVVADNPPIEIAAKLRALAAERDMWRDRLTKAEAQAVRNISDTCAERDRFAEEVKLIRRAWLAVIQAENSCPPSGGCLSKRCGCHAEMEMLIDDARK